MKTVNSIRMTWLALLMAAGSFAILAHADGPPAPAPAPPAPPHIGAVGTGALSVYRPGSGDARPATPAPTSAVAARSAAPARPATAPQQPRR